MKAILILLVSLIAKWGVLVLLAARLPAGTIKIPEFLPVIGPRDDVVVVVALALRYAGKHTPHEALFEAWPGDPRLLARLLGEAHG